MTKLSSNLRVDISGGTLDLWPLFNFVGGAKTINAGLSLNAVSEFRLTESSKILIDISNLNYQKVFQNINELICSNDSELTILKSVLKAYNIQTGFKLKVSSQSPIGGGLGGSSTLLVSIIKSIDKELKRDRSESQTVQYACNLESEILGTPAGTQDYFQAIRPGLSVIHYQAEGISREFFKSAWLANQKANFKLIYSGHPHHSGLNNWQIFQKCVQKDEQTLSILAELKTVSEKVFLDLQTANASNMSLLLKEELNLRRRLATGFVNEPLEKIINFLENLGVAHFKICGAGGGGCLWAIVPEELNTKLQKVNGLNKDIRIIECELIL